MMPTFLFSGTLVTWMAYTIMVSGMISIAALFIHQSELRSGRPLRWIWITATVASVLLAIAAPIRTRSWRSSSKGRRTVARSKGGTSSWGPRRAWAWPASPWQCR